jgi:hypothetical protein
MKVYKSLAGYDTIYPYSLVIKYKPGQVIENQRVELPNINNVLTELYPYIENENVFSVEVIKHNEK